ncbi:MAG: hypothetical protein ACRD43_07395, partial [Pyrinomonadaceae bacterium]
IGEKFYPLRQISTERTYNYKGQVLSLTNRIDEWTANDHERVVSEVTHGGKHQKTEVIWLGGDFYCRRNGGKWTLEPQNCLSTKGWGLVIQESDTYSSQETVLNGHEVKVLHYYSTGRDWKTGPSAFFEEFVWIGKDGLIIRQETSRGLVKPRSVMWSRSEDFNYRSKDVNIEPPIK